MSIVVTVRAITTEELAALHADPTQVLAFLLGDDWTSDEPNTPRRPWWRFWNKAAATPTETPARYASPDEADVVDLDKAWHGMHWLLTGAAGPGQDLRSVLFAHIAVAGCREVGGPEQDVGYGPARTLDVAATRAFCEIVEALDNETCARRFDPRIMEEQAIYPDGIWQAEGPEALQWLLDARDSLLALLRRAVAQQRCVILWAS